MFVFSLLLYGLSYGGGLAFPARISNDRHTVRLAVVLFRHGLHQVTGTYRFSVFHDPGSLFDRQTWCQCRFNCWLRQFRRISSAVVPYRSAKGTSFIQTQLEVADACSGIRSIMSLIKILALCSPILRGREYGARWRYWQLPFRLPYWPISAELRAPVFTILRRQGGFLHDFQGCWVFFLGFALLFGLFYLVDKELNVSEINISDVIGYPDSGTGNGHGWFVSTPSSGSCADQSGEASP